MYSLTYSIQPIRKRLARSGGGGCSFGGTRVNILLYADDIILLSPTRTGLQHMIRNLETYCNMWNLIVNLNKSKIMVFRNGGRLKEIDKWWYKGDKIEVVNTYKYLGITLSSSCSWNKYLTEKCRMGKFAISSIWNKLIMNDKVPLSSKIVCFESVVRAVICYGAQVWGYIESDIVESVQKMFIKKLLKLPCNTPNYLLYLETGFEKLFFYTLNTQINYILKVLSLPHNRLPSILAKQVLAKRIFWCRDWERLGQICHIDIHFDVVETDRLRTDLQSVMEVLREKWRGSASAELVPLYSINNYQCLTLARNWAIRVRFSPKIVI